MDVWYESPKIYTFSKIFFDIICSSYDGDDIYSEFEMVYYAISYVNPEAKYRF